MYEIVKGDNGSSSYTAFAIWGPGKTAKIQCDFSAIMSPKQFREFVQPSLKKQCQKLDYTLYHLDGPDAIKHLDALMEIEELDALQWTPGADERWYPIYDRVKKANKSLWISLENGGLEDWIKKSDKLVRRYGSDGLYLLFPIMEEEEALRLIDKAERDWK
jgi:5-methyltetrahydrofolate--homocysteine methyltransferase